MQILLGLGFGWAAFRDPSNSSWPLSWQSFMGAVNLLVFLEESIGPHVSRYECAMEVLDRSFDQTTRRMGAVEAGPFDPGPLVGMEQHEISSVPARVAVASGQ